MKVSAVIPARLGSTRLARKVLLEINGQPMLWHVWNRVCQAQTIDAVWVATDSPEVIARVESWGGRAVLTSTEYRSGTERVASLVDQLESDLIINVQGDEPLVSPIMLDTLITAWMSTQPDLITPVYQIDTLSDLSNPNIVKVARTQLGQALYFSRSPIPYVRDAAIENWLTHQTFWGHVGVYGYSRTTLAEYSHLPNSPLEEAEKLEQLRYLEAGYIIQTFETDYRPIAVDVAADLIRVQELLGKDSAQ